MKINKVTCWLLRMPFTFPLVREQQYALANFVEIEAGDTRSGGEVRMGEKEAPPR